MLIRLDMTPAEELAWLQAAMVRKVVPKRPGKPLPPERAAQQSVVAYLHRVLPDAVVQHVRNEAAPRSMTPQQRMNFHAMRKRDGLTWGFPDLLLFLADGRMGLVEMKRPVGGIVSTTQDELHGKLRGMGHLVGVATCQDTMRHLLHVWGVTTREAAGAPMREAAVRVAKPRTRLPADPLPW